MSDRPTALDLLRQARALLARRGGWCQNSIWGPKGFEVMALPGRASANIPRQTCAIGALRASALLYGLPQSIDSERAAPCVQYAARMAIEGALPGRCTRSGCSRWTIGRWNDARGRGKHEVLAVFDVAIATLAQPAEDAAAP